MKGQMKKLSRSTVRKLRELQKLIMKEPRRLDMYDYLDIGSLVAPCGTAACLAGSVNIDVVMRRKKKSWKEAGKILDRHSDIHGAHIQFATAMGHLGITETQAQALFYLEGHNLTGPHWPSDFEKLYRLAEDAKLYSVAALVAVERINHFIKTGGRE